MTMSLITGHYQSAPDTVVMRDYKEIREAGHGELSAPDRGTAAGR